MPPKRKVETPSPEVGRALVHHAVMAFRALPPKKYGEPCKLCVHENREEIDFLILMDAKTTEILVAMGLEPTQKAKELWSRTRINKHRDTHLKPLIESVRAQVALTDMPYPRDGSPGEKDWWHFMQIYCLRDKAITAQQFATALNCQKTMIMLDDRIRGSGEERPALPLGAEPAPIAQMDEHDQKLLAAFARSMPKPKEEVYAETSASEID